MGISNFQKKTVFIATLTLTQRDRFDDRTNYLQTFKFSQPEAVDCCSPDGFFLNIWSHQPTVSLE